MLGRGRSVLLFWITKVLLTPHFYHLLFSAIAGVMAGSFWSFFLYYGGLIFCAIFFDDLILGEDVQWNSSLLSGTIAFLCLFFAGHLGQWQPVWGWIVLLLVSMSLLALVLIVVNASINHKKGFLAFVFLVAVMPLVGRYWLPVRETMPSPWLEFSFWGTMASFAWIGVLFYLVFIIITLWLDPRRWGYSLMIMFLSSFFVYLFFQETFQYCLHLIASGPVQILEVFLEKAASDWGHAGWGLVFLGIAFSILILPFHYRLSIHRWHKIFELDADAIKAHPEQAAIRLLTTTVVGLFLARIGLILSLWIALTRLQYTDPSFLFIPHLAQPNLWPPAFQMAQVGLALTLCFVFWCNAFMDRHLHGLGFVQGIKSIKRPYLLGFLSFFIPGGVMLFLIIDQGMRSIAMILGYMALSPIKMPESNVSGLYRGMTYPLDLGDTLQEQEPLVEEDEEDGMSYLQDPGAFKGAVCYWADRYLFLTDNYLLLRHEDVVKKAYAVPVVSPKGFVQLDSSTVLMVGRDAMLTFELKEEELYLRIAFFTEGPVSSFVVHPKGTLVMYGSLEKESVFGYSLLHGSEQIYAQDLAVSGTMAFTPDGQFLAVGTEEGIVVVIEMASSAPLFHFTPDAFDPSPVQHICSGLSGDWIVAYSSGHLAVWDEGGTLYRYLHLPHQITAMVTDPQREHLAYGHGQGMVTVMDTEIRKELHVEEVLSGPVQGLSWEEDDSLMAFGWDALEVVNFKKRGKKKK